MTTTFDPSFNHNTNNNNNTNNSTNPFANELNSNTGTGTGHTLSTLETETTKPGYPSETYYEDHSGRFNDAKNTVAEPTSNSLLTSQDGVTHRENSQFDYLTNAGETARKYLPTRVVEVLGVGVPGNGLENTTTTNTNSMLPSQENSFQPTRGGVGSLPGNPSEANVAKLPEERALEAQVGKDLGRDGVMGTVADPHNVDSIPTKTDYSSPLASNNVGTAAQFSDPITEPFPKSGDGVALQHLARPDTESTEHTRALPTFISSTLTPEAERSQEWHNDTSVDTNKPLPNEGVSTPQTTQPHMNSPHATTPNTSTPQTTKPQMATPHTSTPNTSTPHTTTTQNKSTDTSKGDDASESYSAAQAARQAPNTTPGKSHNEQPYPKTAHDKSGDNHSDRKSSVDNNSTADSENKQSNGKPSMGQKIKGEVKVLAGKLTKDQAKVESGQAMKQGTTA